MHVLILVLVDLDLCLLRIKFYKTTQTGNSQNNTSEQGMEQGGNVLPDSVIADWSECWCSGTVCLLKQPWSSPKNFRFRRC
jgi:hypothetical protein